MLDKIHAPIGLTIATETPEEIAVSIMAGIIDFRRRSV
jgi:xanthine/CO dehydrogenase XdhC/CoxF family maturation factor